jgi:hypothetical protein
MVPDNFDMKPRPVVKVLSMTYPDLPERTKDILLRPGRTWLEIREEPVTVKQIYMSYAAILAAVPVVAHLIGMTVVGIFFLGIRYRAPFLNAVGYAVCSYVFSLAGLYVFALIVDALAPRFLSRRGFTNAVKLVVYSCTPAWVAGALLVVPALAFLSLLLSLYGFYLFHAGLSPLMDTPGRNRFFYFVVLACIGLLLLIAVNLVTSLIFPEGRMGVI